MTQRVNVPDPRIRACDRGGTGVGHKRLMNWGLIEFQGADM